MASITGRISVSALFSQSVPGVPTNGGQAPAVAAAISATFAPGTAGTPGAADQVDLKYTKTLSFAAAAQPLDLTNLLDVLGATITFARVRSIVLKMRGAADGNVLKLGYSGTTANAWTSLNSNPGQIFLQAFATAGNDAVFVLTAPAPPATS